MKKQYIPHLGLIPQRIRIGVSSPSKELVRLTRSFGTPIYQIAVNFFALAGHGELTVYYY